MDEEPGGFERRMPIEEYNPTEGMERSELRQEIDKAMEKLSYEHRTVLVLHEFERMEYREIAKSMQCSIGTVMSRLFYARRRLAKMLISLKIKSPYITLADFILKILAFLSSKTNQLIKILLK